ncbi:RNA-binding protein cabeza isoform X10 [Procambarus clarkii]|uniref:RNA-binding protein cabeza isoform X10 n=1 Tax=Procambarus clarkii TaxID=6728 RepID=UPI003742893C
MPPKNSKRNVKGGEGSSGEEGGGASSPKRKRFISEEKDRKYDSEDSMEDTKDSNDWGGGWDRYSDQDRYSSRSSSKPGDWDCPSCQFSNFASRTACFKCRTPKDGDSFGSGGRVGGGGGGGGGGMRDMRPGDWACQKCQFHNFSSRGMCYKCNAPREGGRSGGMDGGRGSMRAGDWECQQCQFHNFASRDQCFKCSSPK